MADPKSISQAVAATTPKSEEVKPQAPTQQPTTPAPAPKNQNAEKTAEKKPDVVLPEHIAAFAEKQSEWLKREISYKEKLAEIEKYKKAAEEYERLQAELKADPYSVAERHGASLEAWAKRMVQGDPRKPTLEEIVPKLLDEIKSLREKYEQQERAVQIAASRSDAAVYASEMMQYMQGMESEKWRPVKQYMDTLQLISGKDPDLIGAVQQMIDESRAAGGKLLTPREACEKLAEEASSYMNKLRDVIIGSPATTAPSAPAQTQSPQQTLTTAAETQATAAPDLAAMTHEQRLQEVTRRLLAGAYDHE